ncbi:hemerythrin domain-containing protein [Hydrotalea sp.]|uniref:hemerythrin domain-containing protein n=1 Tax=Hydrotalea sp. TaxID=2881279 RepID=UPI00260F13E2|nr:hemerythrin domain-containing protein [Hydrotalea sp.]
MAIKRTEAMQPLSRQHHNGLLFCLLLKKAVAKNANIKTICDFTIHFWQTDLQHHFQLEETYLMDLGNTYPVLNNGLQQMFNEHRLLQQFFQKMAIHVAYQDITQLSELLEKHIRFEERALFPHIESTINSDALQRIGKGLQGEEDHNCMQYPIRFWE